MAQIMNEKTGNIVCYQGDTIVIPITGIDTSYNYTAYCQIRNYAGKPVGPQFSIQTNYLPDVTFTIPHSVSALMVVPTGEDSQIYTYGIALELNDVVDTLFIGDNATFGTENTITVYRKKVEGA